MKFCHAKNDMDQIRTDEDTAITVEGYACCICGITLPECKHWGPVCGRSGRRVCAECCRKCGDHISWSGIWRCAYITPEQRREASMKRISSRFNEENARITVAYQAKRREEARKWAIKKAKQRKKQSKKTG